MTPLSDRLLDSLATAARREGLVDALYSSVTTPIGVLTVVQGARGVVRVGFEEEPRDRVLAEVAGALGARVLRADRELAPVRDAFEAYFEREGDLTDVPYDLALVRSPFRRRLLRALHDDVPRGRTVRYGDLAASAGSPRAARAAGSACATNPVPLVVPCHRVLPSTGRVGNYGGGRTRKLALLQMEGALPATRGA